MKKPLTLALLLLPACASGPHHRDLSSETAPLLGPIIRRRCPEGFVLTEWTRQRYGTLTMLYLSVMTLVTLFLYTVSELSAVGQVVATLTGLDPLPVVIVQGVVATIYTGKVLRIRSGTGADAQPSAAFAYPSSPTTSKAP